MKRRLYILPLCLLLGLLFLTACQHDALLLEQEGTGQPAANGTDSCYVNLHIVSRSKNSTRATEAEENAIYDGIVCIFEGASPTTATLKTATVIDQLILNPGTAGAPSVSVTQRLATGTHPYSGDHRYVLVLLNTSATGFKVEGSALKLNGNSLTGQTIGDIQSQKVNSVGSPQEHVGLFMSNAAASLVEVTSTYLYDTPDDAASGSRLTINVERAAARVKVTNNIPAAMPLSNITLVGATTEHPLIHKMSWMVTNYNEGGYAVSNGSTDTGTPTNTFAAKDFTYFHQHSLQSGDEVYIGENYNDATKTQVIVELQLKDGSFLLGDCYSFNWDDKHIYTTTDGLVDYFKAHWDAQKVYYPDIYTRTSDEVFRNTIITIDANDQVKVTLTNSDFNATEQAALSSLAYTLSGLTRYFHDGKMYYTYTLDDIERNNAYNLSLVEEADTDTRHVVATFKFDQGTSGQTATFSNSTASLFESSSVALGSNLNYYGANTTFGQTQINTTAEHDAAATNESDYIDFLLKPVTGWTFTPSQVSFKATRYGTDGGYLNISWINSGGASTELLVTGIRPYRNSNTPNILEWSHSVTAGVTGDGSCGLRLQVYSLKETKQVGFSDIVIKGTLSKAVSITNPKKSINGIGRATP